MAKKTPAAEIKVDAVPVYDQIVTGHFYSSTGYRAYRPRGSGDWLMIYTANGGGYFGSKSANFHANQGDLVLLRPGTPHDYGVDPNLPTDQQLWEIYWAHFQPRTPWLAWTDWPQPVPGILLCQINEKHERARIKSLVSQMNHNASSPARHAQDLAMNLLEQVILSCDSRQERTGDAAVDPRVRKAIDYASQHLADALDVETLAEQGGLSVSRFAHLFREQTGQSPQRYVESLRIRRARQLLERAGLGIKEIAAQTGFRDPFYFANRFRKLVGKSPSEYRQRSQRVRAGEEREGK